MPNDDTTSLDADGLWEDDPGKMSTYSRRRINPLTMTAEDVDIRDIARALTMQCRYNGHVGRFYSVAEHSQRVADVLKGTPHELTGLLHDAAEAYLGDMIRPLKHGEIGKAYLQAEEHVERCIAKAFGLNYPWPGEVLAADREVLLEQELAGEGRRWQEHGFDPEPRLRAIEHQFLQRFHDLRTTLVIGLSGYAQSGKDTFASFLVADHGFERIAFADILREVLYALNPLVEAQITELGEDTERTILWSCQRLVDKVGWDRAKTSAEESPWGVRGYLQRLGTEAGREIIGQDIWVNAVMSRVSEGHRYVFTDVRFPNEAAAIHGAGGSVVRINRAGQGAVNRHASETQLDGYLFDYVYDMADDPENHRGIYRGFADQLLRQIASSKVAR